MAEEAIVAVPPSGADPSASRSVFDTEKTVPVAAPPPSDVRVAEQKAEEDMLQQADALFKGQPQRTTTEPDKAQSKEEKAEVSDRKLPPPIKGERKQEDAPPQDLTQQDLDKLPFDKWPRSAKEWKEAKEIAQKQIGHFKQQLEEATKQAKNGSPEVNEIIKERDSLRAELRAIDIERDPGFKSKYDGKFEGIRANLESVLSKDDVDNALAIFNQKPGVKRTDALEKFTGEMSMIKQSAIGTALARHDESTRERAAELEINRRDWDKIQLENRARSEQRDSATKQMFEKSFDNIVKEWTDPKDGYEFMRKTGDQKADSQVDETVSLAKSILTGENTPDEMARAAMYAAMSPRLIQAYVEQEGIISKLTKELKALKTSNPSLSTSGAMPADSMPGDDVAYGEAIARIAQQAGLR